MLYQFLSAAQCEVAVTGSTEDLGKIKQQFPSALVLYEVKTITDLTNLMSLLRNRGLSPFMIFLHAGVPCDPITLLELGAEDVVQNLFSAREVLARVRAIQRRLNTTAAQQMRPARLGRSFGRFEMNAACHQLVCLETRETIPLTTHETKLLNFFLSNPRKTISRTQLSTFMYRDPHHINYRKIDSLIYRLRQKIEVDPKAPEYIHTVWGAGYLFQDEAPSNDQKEAC